MSISVQAKSSQGRKVFKPVSSKHAAVPTHVVTLTQVGTSVYLGQTHLGTPFQVPAWVRKFSLGSTGDKISSLILFEAYLYSRISSIK